MTPEHKFIVWTTALTALPTITFTGMVAFWTWRRDQERIIVHKSPVHWNTLDETEGALCGAGIVVRNLSLFPVRIAGLAFRIHGKTIFVFDHDEHVEDWPLELASHAKMNVSATGREWKRLEALGVPDKIMDWKFVAVAVTETGARFSSNRLSVGIVRPLRNLWRRFSKWRVRRLA
jgi:hypothetical protein